eukprot:6672025-Pyramimonas_sp.AAC.2
MEDREGGGGRKEGGVMERGRRMREWMIRRSSSAYRNNECARKRMIHMVDSYRRSETWTLEDISFCFSPPKTVRNAVPPARAMMKEMKNTSKGGRSDADRKDAAAEGRKAAAPRGREAAVPKGRKAAAPTGRKAAASTGRKAAAPKGPQAAAPKGPQAAASKGRKAAAGNIRSLDHPSLGVMTVTYGTKVSYICTRDDANRPRLYIQVSESQSRKHSAMIVNILKHVCEHDLDKSAALAYRATLLQ